MCIRDRLVEIAYFRVITQTPLGERVAGEAVLRVGRIRGAYGGAEAPPFPDADVTPIYVTKY